MGKKGRGNNKGSEEIVEGCFCSFAESIQINKISPGFVNGMKTVNSGERGGELSGDISKEKASS